MVYGLFFILYQAEGIFFHDVAHIEIWLKQVQLLMQCIKVRLNIFVFQSLFVCLS